MGLRKACWITCLTAVVAAGAVQTTTTLTSSANPSVFGHPITLTATISPVSANGTITFFDGSTILGSKFVSQGKASITTSLLQAGPRLLRAYFTGDNNNVPSTSPVLKQTVNAVGSSGFQPALILPNQTAVTAVAVGDFDNDGRADLAIVNANATDNNVTVLLGNGDGTFKVPINYTVGPGATSIIAGDFNGDARTDLAIVCSGDNNVYVLNGNGIGAFTNGGIYGTATSPSAIAAGDFTGNGVTDLVVTTANGISVFIGTAGGGFLPSVFYPVGLSSGVAIGDFNADGLADLAIATPSGVAVLLGLGNGTFQPKVSYPTGVGGGPILVADFNGDGKMDIAAAAGPSTSVILGNGDGTFQSAVQSIAGSANTFVQTMATGDFDGDGKVDLAVVSSSGVPNSASVSVLIGLGNGLFQPPTLYNVTAVTYAGVADFNNDGTADLITLGLGPLGILLGIPIPVIVPPPPPTPPSVVAGGVLNAASFTKDAAGHGTAVAPGSLVSVFGTFPGAVQADAATVPFGPTLGGVSVTFNNIPAPVRDVIPAANELNVQMPFGVVPTGPANTVNVVVTIAGLSSTPVAVPIVPAAPGIFTIPPTGLGNAVLVFTDPSDNVGKIAAPVSASATIGLPTAPVPRGSFAFFYATGLGALSPPVADGAGGIDKPPQTHFATNPIVMIGGFAASVQFAGQAPGFPGVNQINVIIPSNAPTGDAVPIQVKSSDGSVSSNVGTIAIR